MSYDDILDDMFIGLPTDPVAAFVIFYKELRIGLDNESIDRLEYVTAMEAFIECYELSFERDWSPSRHSLNSLAMSHFANYKAELRKISLVNQVKLSKENSIEVFDSVEIIKEHKKEIRELVNKVKEKIDKSSIDQDKKDSLHKKLDHFLFELEQSKTRLAAFTSSLIQLASATGEAAKELEPIVKIFERITKAIGLGSKEQVQLTWEEQKKIEHQPTTEDEETKK